MGVVKRRYRCAVVSVSLFTLGLLCLSIGLCFGQESLSLDQYSAFELLKQSRDLAKAGLPEEALAPAEKALVRGKQEFGARHRKVGFILNNLATLSVRLNHLDEALGYAKRAVDVIRTAHGTDKLSIAILTNNFASILFRLGRIQEAEKRYREAHELSRPTRGVKPARITAQTAYNLGRIYAEMSRLTQAQEYFEKAIAIYRKLPNEENIAVAKGYLKLAGILLLKEQADQALQIAEKARLIFASISSASPTDSVDVEIMLARIAIRQSRLREAEDRLYKALQRLEDSNIRQRLKKASVLTYIGLIHILKGQSVEAERVYQRILVVYRNTVGEQHPAVGRALQGLAIAHQNLGQWDEAERMYQRSIDIFKASFGKNDASVAATRMELALFLSEQGRSQDAIREARAALHILEQLPESPEIKRAYARSALGFALQSDGQLDAAAQSFEHAIARMTELRGDDSMDLPPGLIALGEIYLEQKRFEAAEHRLERVIRIQERTQAATPRHLAKSFSLRARLHRARRQLDQALTMGRRATDVLSQRATTANVGLSTSALSEQQQARDIYTHQIDLLYDLTRQRPGDGLTREALIIAQQAQVSSTSQAVARMAARFAAGGNALAKRIRERQDLVERWRHLDGRLTNALSTASGTARGTYKRMKEKRWQAERARTESQIHRLDRALQLDFPRYAQLTNPEPLTVGEVRQYLRSKEALLVQTSTEEATFLWLVRPRAPVAFQRNNLGSEHLKQLVSRIRRSIEGQVNMSRADLPDFDVAGAYELYRKLLAPFESLLENVTHLIFVPDGALQSLPLTLLVTEPTEPPSGVQDYPDIAWLGRRLAISTLPAVNSLRALRVFARPSTAWQPFLGVGDPNLRGPTTGTRGPSNATFSQAQELATRLGPLPETFYELRDIARTLDSNSRYLLFRERATEAAVKHHPELSSFRVIAFGTHGLIAGGISGMTEPALVLTPPISSKATDDGLLTASEIAQLELNAEWVILSACNTSGYDGTLGATGLSGLVKSFFYAGARALLVSHWSVASDAAGLITSGTLERLTAEPHLSRAEALSQAIRPLMDGKHAPHLAHPRYWAPFVIVGEGGSGMAVAWQGS